MKFFLLVIATIPFALCVNAKERVCCAVVKGQLTYESDSTAVAGAQIVLTYPQLLTMTDQEGYFYLSEVLYGTYILTVQVGLNPPDTFRIFVDQKEVNLGRLFVAGQSQSNIIDLVPEADLYFWDGTETIDPITPLNIALPNDRNFSIARFGLAALGFRMRGFHTAQSVMYLNGLPFNDIKTGQLPFAQWAGLQSSLADASMTVGLQMDEDGLGNEVGAMSVQLNASEQDPYTSIRYAYGNGRVKNQMQVKHHTGKLSNGWALSLSASSGWAKEGYVEGTFYQGYFGYLGLSKQISKKSSVHFNTFGTLAREGLSAATTKEARTLASDNFYNPNWGMLNGEKRNAMVRHLSQPAFLLHYEYRPSIRTLLRIVAGYEAGSSGTSSLDWYNAPDPRPDYYQYLPSYWLQHTQTPNTELAAAYTEQWQNKESTRQIDWPTLYDRNGTQKDVSQVGDGIRSAYVLGDDRENKKAYHFGANLKKNVSAHLDLYGGVSFHIQEAAYYRRLLDLLGGDYYVDLNQFAERSYPDEKTFHQPDLFQSNHVVRVGDNYGYHYLVHSKKATGWLQAASTFSKVDFFAGIGYTWDVFSREGLYRNGLFPADSYGKSRRLDYGTYQSKAGIRYKLNGYHYLFVHGSLRTSAPQFDDVFYAPKIRDAMIDHPVAEKISAWEAGYLFRWPRWKGNATVFFTDRRGGTSVQRFYHETYSGFVNYVLQDINISHGGLEMVLEGAISRYFTVTAMISWMQVMYQSQSQVSIYPDQDTTAQVVKSKAYLAGFFAGQGPQSVYALGIKWQPAYRSFVTFQFNFLDRNYVELNPARFTEEAVGLLEPGGPQWAAIRYQDRLPSISCVDFAAGKSFAIKRWLRKAKHSPTWSFHVGINNILNNKNGIIKGSQQLRFDFDSKNPEQFPDKYRYAMGINYFITTQLRF